MDEQEPLRVRLNGKEAEKVREFKYLGSTRLEKRKSAKTRILENMVHGSFNSYKILRHEY